MSAITPNLIPHHEFHKGIWLLPLNRPNWYYFKKTINPNHISNKTFLESVDKPLRELVSFLHQNGIKTTPSCSGHNMPLKHFKKVYRSLKKDRKEIRTSGLILKNIETGKLSVYYDPNYELPWHKSEFITSALDYQQKGILGIKTEKRKDLKELLLNMRIKGVEQIQSDSVILICTKGGKKNDNAGVWKKITNEIVRGITLSNFLD